MDRIDCPIACVENGKPILKTGTGPVILDARTGVIAWAHAMNTKLTVTRTERRSHVTKDDGHGQKVSVEGPLLDVLIVDASDWLPVRVHDPNTGQFVNVSIVHFTRQKIGGTWNLSFWDNSRSSNSAEPAAATASA